MATFWAPQALLPAGWARAVRLVVGGDGRLAEVAPDAEPAAAGRLAGPVVPGIANLHSHAFQRAMAGLTQRGGGGDDFWSWRQAMYGFIARLAPDDVLAIAAQLYAELLQGGYTAVAEFHYLHHRPDGRPYDDPATMSHAIVAAADRAGMRLTLLPVLYAAGGFGGAPAGEGQRRFLHHAEGYLALLQRLGGRVPLGIAPHSLRAVPPDMLRAVLQAADPALPVHMHIAEQVAEVEQCLAWSGARPVRWLLDHVEVGARWCLVHATHIDDAEVGRLAATGAVAGLCPTTEADLGDGLFPLPAWLAADGRLGIGSDSQVATAAASELRLLEYGQRLAARRRAVAATAAVSTGARLFRAALAGGAQALGQPVGRIEPGAAADFLVLDSSHPQLCGREGDDVLDAWLFGGDRNPVRDVFVAGRQLVAEGRHIDGEPIAAAFRGAVARLRG